MTTSDPRWETLARSARDLCGVLQSEFSTSDKDDRTFEAERDDTLAALRSLQADYEAMEHGLRAIEGIAEGAAPTAFVLAVQSIVAALLRRVKGESE